MPYSYSSVQVNLPDSLRKDITEWGALNVPEEALYTEKDDDDYGRRADSHVTVLYGIEDANPSQVSDLLKTEKPLTLKLAKISMFTSGDKYDVLKVEVEVTPELRAIHEKLKKKTENVWSYDDYNPHITIAYLKKGHGLSKEVTSSEVFDGRCFEVFGFLFSSKDGRQVILQASTSTSKKDEPVVDPWGEGFARELEKEAQLVGLSFRVGCVPYSPDEYLIRKIAMSTQGRQRRHAYKNGDVIT